MTIIQKNSDCVKAIQQDLKLLHIAKGQVQPRPGQSQDSHMLTWLEKLCELSKKK